MQFVRKKVYTKGLFCKFVKSLINANMHGQTNHYFKHLERPFVIYNKYEMTYTLRTTFVWCRAIMG